MSDKTLFEKILDREIPAKIAYEDERCLAIHDIDPKAPTHLLIIPKRVIPRIAEAGEADAELLGHLLLTAKKLGSEHGPEGFRIVINNGPHGGETVPHLHVHLLAGRPLEWPPG
ncbi:histidine triad nucleotide-binding protein [Ruficoccus amylovorans]|uniref:Histidine triad nucleotide-binding protein n=1 Tax=Ruficoccus amylovorans TaxID=1804625 RepID=A0A842H9E0_9BACT|nr:histidine triad nucleotide-binding protein [Ruficoccus amylovorans]MBC2592875.1 histidine triad nucleotide-binding protein [Ruficoccus amylovorans]